MNAIAHATVWAAGFYLGLGVLVGVPFVAAGIGRIDPAAKGAPWGFRLLVLPGVVALWPILARRWAAAARGR